MITLDQGANGDTKKMDKKDIVSPKAQDINLEDTGKDSPLDSNATSDVNMDDSEATDSSASSKSTPDPLFTSKMTFVNVVKKCLNLYQLLQVNSRKNVFLRTQNLLLLTIILLALVNAVHQNTPF